MLHCVFLFLCFTNILCFFLQVSLILAACLLFYTQSGTFSSKSFGYFSLNHTHADAFLRPLSKMYGTYTFNLGNVYLICNLNFWEFL